MRVLSPLERTKSREIAIRLLPTRRPVTIHGATTDLVRQHSEQVSTELRSNDMSRRGRRLARKPKTLARYSDISMHCRTLPADTRSMAIVGLNFLRRIRRLLGRIRRRARVMPLTDAFKFALSENKPVDVQIYLSSIGREITLRGATTDVQSFEKVFIAEEYSLPFEISPKVIVDAGANIGMATLYFASRYPGARVLAIEPESKNFEMLQRNCARLSNVVLVQAALWPVQRRLAISDPGDGAWAYSVTAQSANESTAEVSAITMEEIFCKLAANNIDLLKLDIEGSERELFATDAGAWLGRVECIVVELHDRLRPGCAKAFYSALTARDFFQEIRGENIFVRLARPFDEHP
jgi:FkbM family methyltransferase